MRMCHKCRAEWVSEKKQPHFKEYCDGCSAYLHCCKNCRFFDTSAPNQCYIPNTETVSDRSKMNYCDEFEFRDGDKGGAGDAKRNDAVKQANALFGEDAAGGGPGVSDRPDAARDAFSDLFGGE